MATRRRGGWGRAGVLGKTPPPPARRAPTGAGEGTPIKQAMRTGAFAEYVVVDASQAVPIPKDVPLDSAALVACAVLTGVGAVFNTAAGAAGGRGAGAGAGGVAGA